MEELPSLDNYEGLEEIGRGSFSIVYKAQHRASREYVALKVINKAALSQDTNAKANERLQTEVAILKKVNHPNVVPLKEIIETEDEWILVMELVTGGELFDKIVQRGSYTEKEACATIYKIVSAIDYLHSQHIVHRDLKPENLLLRANDDTQVLISDFGLSKLLPEFSTMMSTACGTPYYVAPEVLKAEGYTKQVDMWSVGVIAYFLLSGFPPFMGESLKEIVDQVLACQYTFPSPYWDHISDEATDFIEKLLVEDPAQRWTAAQALHHPWLEKRENLQTTHPLNNIASLQKNMATLRATKKQRSF